MKKTIYYVVTCISLIFLFTCILLKGTYYSFDSTNVKNNIKTLSDEKFSGRITGSKENYDVASILKNECLQNGLLPLGDDYLEGFQVVSPYRNNSEPKMQITYKNDIIKTFEYGVEYKEDMINFKDSKISFSKDDKVRISKSTISIEKNLTTYIFYVSKDKGFSFRSSFVSSSPYGFAIGITTNTYNIILDSLRSGQTLDITLPFSTQTQEVFNVVGKIEGKDDSLTPLVLTAHYDHLGRDALGNFYPGALDNASGTSFLLELLKTFSSLPQPKRDIIFVFFNAEEFGLLGSKNFADSHYELLRNSQVINFDMVGVENFPLTFMLGSSMKEKESILLNSLKDIAKYNEITVNEKYEDSSDHASFSNIGIDSLTISHSDTSSIHTPRDTVDKISTDSIKSVYDVIDNKVFDYAFKNPLIAFYETKMLLVSFLFSIILIAFGLIYKLKTKKFS